MGRSPGKGRVYHGIGFRNRASCGALVRLGRCERRDRRIEARVGKRVRSDGSQRGRGCGFVETDVTKEESVKREIEQTVSRFGKLDILYNCAGGSIVEDAPVTEVDMSVWQHTMSLDLLGTFHCCRHGIPELTKSGGGAIVNMSSVAALRGFPAHVYVAAKGGIISFTRALAGEYAKNGIRCQRDLPGIGEN